MGDNSADDKAARNIQVIELHMLDKTKYLPLTVVSGFTVRSLLYPFNLVRTRLQLQKHNSQYNGMFDAFSKIVKYEGARGLYKGFWVTQLMMVSQMTYISTYETVRSSLKRIPELKDKRIRSFIAGGCASCASQTFVVPIDVIAQHLQTLRASPSEAGKVSDLHIPKEVADSRLGATGAVVKAVYRQYGLQGFYKGYFVSLGMYSSSSALWWMFYDSYCDLFASFVPPSWPRLLIQVFSGPAAGITTSILTNPLDIVRVRVQVKNSPLLVTCRKLIQEEQFKIFTKGLSARLVSSVTFSFFIVLGYESIKRLSVTQDYKSEVRW